MANQHRQENEETISLRIWTHAQAVKAVPYFRSVVQSLREYWLQWQRARLQVWRLDRVPGRPDRRALILRAETVREAELVEERFDDALLELESLDVRYVDAAKGVAQIPFRQEGDLAWFIFDLFAPQGLVGWRFDTDPPETRRFLAEPIDRGAADQVFASMQ